VGCLAQTHGGRAADAQRHAGLDPKSHAIVSAHISVSDPLPSELEHDDREELQELLRAIEPFEVRYSMPSAFRFHRRDIFLLGRIAEANLPDCTGKRA